MVTLRELAQLFDVDRPTRNLGDAGVGRRTDIRGTPTRLERRPFSHDAARSDIADGAPVDSHFEDAVEYEHNRRRLLVLAETTGSC